MTYTARMPARAPLCEGGPELAPLALGTWRLLNGPPESAATGAIARLVSAAADHGLTTIDTAEIYGRYEVEEALGGALRSVPGLRDRLEIVTKLGIYVPVPRHPERKVPFYNATADRIVKSAEKSLRLLGTDRLDVLLIHRPDWLTSADETATGLERLLTSGKVRSVGVSNFDVEQFALLDDRLRGRVTTNQVELSLFHAAALTDGTLAQAERLRRRPMAWSPLGGGRLWNETDETAIRVRDALREIAPAYDNAPPEALALAWTMALPSAPLPIVGTTRPDRLPTLARALTIHLSREHWYHLWQAAHNRRIP